MSEAYCVRCKKKVEVKDGKEVTMKNGNRAVRGKCSICSTTVMCILGKGKKAA